MGATASNKKYGKARKETGNRYTDSFKGFVDIPLLERDREAVAEAAQVAQVDICEFITRCAQEGYKFSLSADWEHESYIATVTGKADGCPNKGYALSGRGPTAYGAIICLWYKVDRLCGWGAWSDGEEGKDVQLPLFR